MRSSRARAPSTSAGSAASGAKAWHRDVGASLPVRLDDGVTMHNDMHDGLGEYPAAQNPRVHPEWWGKTFFKHFPNHGFVGDIFTVNGVAYPQLEVKRRRYRLRFLDASIARIYEFKLMSSTQGPKSAVSLGYTGNDLQGQYRIPDGQQCMKWTEVAADGGIIPFPVVRDSFELWPAKRREFVVDFSKYMDGTPTTKGDVIYLTNVMKMPDGRMWSNSSRFSPDPNYKVPMRVFAVDDFPKTPSPNGFKIQRARLRDNACPDQHLGHVARQGDRARDVIPSHHAVPDRSVTPSGPNWCSRPAGRPRPTASRRSRCA